MKIANAFHVRVEEGLILLDTNGKWICSVIVHLISSVITRQCNQHSFQKNEKDGGDINTTILFISTTSLNICIV